MLTIMYICMYTYKEFRACVRFTLQKKLDTYEFPFVSPHRTTTQWETLG